MNAKVEQKARSHESILRSAARLVREKGISGARVADVMKGAALTVGGFTLGCPLPAVVGEVGTTAPQHGAIVAEQLQALIDGLADHLPAGGIVPRRMLAIGLVALMYGGLSLSRAVKGTDLSDEVLRACRALGAAAVRGAKGERQ